MSTAALAPRRHEAAEYYFTYIDLVPPGDIRGILERQLVDVLDLFERVPESKARYRYAPGKWSVAEVVSHLSDAERVLAFRAFWFARGFDSALPSFDQEVAMRHAAAEARSLRQLVDELGAVRAATINLFRHMPEEAWERRGTASDNPFTVRALAYIIAGHVAHHVAILKARYAM